MYGDKDKLKPKNATYHITKCIKLETIVPNEWVSDVVNVFIEKAKTSNSCNGKIFISEVGKAIVIRTLETDLDVLKYPSAVIKSYFK